MNLHDIGRVPADEQTELILRYMQEEAYTTFTWRIDPETPNAVQYQTHYDGPDWESLSARDTLTYLNRAQAWADEGYPRR